MKILVIGGTGLVGSNLLPRLVERNDEVFTLTRNESRLEKIRELGCNGVIGDIRNPKTFQNDLHRTHSQDEAAAPGISVN